MTEPIPHLASTFFRRVSYDSTELRNVSRFCLFLILVIPLLYAGDFAARLYSLHAFGRYRFLASRDSDGPLFRLFSPWQFGRRLDRFAQRRLFWITGLSLASPNRESLDADRVACGMGLGRDLLLWRSQQWQNVPRPAYEFELLWPGMVVRRYRRP